MKPGYRHNSPLLWGPVSVLCTLLVVAVMSNVRSGPTTLHYNHAFVFTQAASDTPSTDTPQLHYPIEDWGDNFLMPPRKHNSFDLDPPENLEREVDYDPERRSYNLRQTIGESFFRDTEHLTYEEFYEQEFKNKERQYWKKRSRAASLLDDKSVIPELHVDNEAFDEIFGGKGIEIEPTGNVNLTFGGNYQSIDNPMYTEQQKSFGGFLFDMDININVTGSIGDNMKINFNYNTEAQFNFENEIKLQHTGDEDQIIQNIEAGNVGFNPESQLINGSQSLFGLKTQLQFGRLTITSVASQQKSSQESIEIQGGAQTQDFEVMAHEYEMNKHFFLAHHFRDNYNDALAELPVINSLISIERVEVWITNRGNQPENARDIVALMDLGDRDPHHPNITSNNYNVPDNDANTLYAQLTQDKSIRDNNTILQQLQSKLNLAMVGDFEKTFARKLSENEYKLHDQLGYISLNQTLAPDEVLAVAYEYTYQGKVYQVGEFSQDVPPGNQNENVLFLKMLKSTAIRNDLPIWDLMMKNIYSLNAYQINKEDFMLNVLYQEPGGGEKRYIPESKLKGIQLIRVLNLDNLNSQLDPMPDGMFDFVPGITIDPQKGKLIFPVVEPFGNYLRAQFDNNTIANKYVYDMLYDSTQIIAEMFPELNRYIMRGTYKSEGGSEIQLNRMNIPRGSVSVTAGGRQLQEGTDYTVDYMLGRVKILNESVLNSGQPIRVNFESSDMFGVQQKSMFGTRADYWITDNFSLGGTLLHLNERPLTQKVNFGNEPISNTVWGLDAGYQTESEFLTRLVDRIPLISTKEISTINMTGEYARLHPGSPRAIDLDEEPTTYLDDFEGSRSFFDLKLPVINWQLASTPQGALDELGNNMFPEADSFNHLAYGHNRAKLAWYLVDPMFTRNIASTPDHIKDDPEQQSNHLIREIHETEVFQQRDPPPGQPNVIPCLNLAYYPHERGPYNYDVEGLNEDGTLQNPKDRWGGIMQPIISNDFQAANVEYIEFWVLDPFHYEPFHNGGDIYIQLGNISEDILRDGRYQYENGLPKSPHNITGVDTTAWGRVPINPPVVKAFDNEAEARKMQDVGLDGLRDEDELSFFQEYLDSIRTKYGANSSAYQQAQEDPSADNYHYYRGSDLDDAEVDVFTRYKNFNSPDGNSPTTDDSPEPYSTTATNIPNSEDINDDNALNQAEQYFQYRVKINPNDLEVGKNFVTDRVDAEVELRRTGETDSVTWYQIRIPVQEYQRKQGSIDFKSIRFMRLFLTNFDTTIHMRFARMGLVRNQWRRYLEDLRAPGEYKPHDNEAKTLFDLTVVNIEENANRQPIPYTMPPGIQREQIMPPTGTGTIQRNEQSLALRVGGLRDGDARSAFKNVDMDLRQFRKIKMFIHAESFQDQLPLQDGDVTAFIRIGMDNTHNYYEYEIPLKLTDFGVSKQDDHLIWPEENELDLRLEELVQAKMTRNQQFNDRTIPYTTQDNKGNTIKVVGNPDMSRTRVIMLGVRNPKASDDPTDDGSPRSAEVWFNELRLSDFEEEGGSAAVGRIDAQLADFASLSLSGNMHTIGWGSVDQRLKERHQDNFRQYDIASTFQLGKFFPKEAGVRLPMFLGYTESVSNPRFDAYDGDMVFQDRLDYIEQAVPDPEEAQRRQDSIKKASQDFTSIKSINFSNVRIAPKTQRDNPLPWSIRNWNFTYAYTERFERDPLIDTNLTQTHKGEVGYNYAPKSKPIEPLRKLIKPQWSYLKLFRDINFNPIPTNIGFRSNFKRKFNKTTLRSIGAEKIPIKPFYDKYFNWDRHYDLKFNLTKSLSVDFSASTNSRVDEPPGAIDTEAKRDSIWTNIKNLGRPTDYHHSMSARYNVPLGKLPLTEWINMNVQYNANYQWDAASLTNRAQSLGNVISNAQNKQVNLNLNTSKLYQGLDKLYEQVGSLFTKQDEEEDEADKKEDAEEDEEGPTFTGKMIEQLITGIRNLKITYREDRSTTVPGFMLSPSFMGASDDFSAPGFDFLFGHQPGNPLLQNDFTPGEEWLDEAAARGWISTDSILNQRFQQTYSQEISGNATIEPIKGLRITLNASKNFSKNYSEYFRDTMPGQEVQFAHLNPMDRGNFSMTFISWQTAFLSTDSLGRDEAYYNFEEFRATMSQRLADQNSESAQPIDTLPEYMEGYGPTSQDVLVSAFLAAYTGEKPNEVALQYNALFPRIPKPNWRINFNGLNLFEILKEHFSTFTMNHAYNSKYSVGNFLTNLNHRTNRFGEDSARHHTSGNIFPEHVITQVTIAEQMSPLVGIDAQMKNNLNFRVSYSRTRTLNLSLTNYQLMENKSNEWRIGIGYRIPHLQVPFSLGPLGGGQTQNTLNLKFDFAIRNSLNVIHRLDQGISEPTGGMTTISISPLADYAVSQNLTAQLFVDWRKDIPATSISFPRETVNGGLRIRYTLSP